MKISIRGHTVDQTGTARDALNHLERLPYNCEVGSYDYRQKIISLTLDGKKLIIPAPNGDIILFCTNNGSVHGLSLCLLRAYANPLGFRGVLITATLERAPGIINSVSKIGFASSNGLPEISLNLAAQELTSSWLGRILVTHSSYS